MISRFKAVWLVLFTAMTVALLVGCNDALRQFILPVPQPTGDACSACTSHAVVLSRNPAGSGSTMHIDATGDVNVGVLTVGPDPLFLAKGNNRIFVINNDQTVTSYFGLLVGSSTTAINPNTITLPNTVSGAIAGATSSTGDFFLAEKTSNKVNQISSGAQAVTATLSVGTAPVFVVGSPRNSKIYVVNQGSNNVTVISTTDNTNLGNITVGSAPVWGVMSDDGSHAFIVNQGSGAVPGSVSVIDTQLDTVIANIPVGKTAGSQPNFAVYDAKNQRLWVNNSGENSVSVIKADGIDLTIPVLPRKIADITLSAAPTALAVLPDGTRAYAALGGCVPGTNHLNLIANLPGCNGNQVSVIDALGLAETGLITVGPGAVAIDAANDSSRVYVVGAHDTTVIKDNVHNPNCTADPCPVGGGCTVLPCKPGPSLPDRTFQTPSLSIIRTATNAVFRPPTDASVSSLVPSVHAPQQDFKCVAALDLNFNKTVPLPCPTQNAFAVRIAP